MKIHHLIHQLMLLLAEHPEAKDYNLVIASDDSEGDWGPAPQPVVHPETKEIWL